MRKLLLSIVALAAFALAPALADAQTYARGQTGAVGGIVTATTPDGASVKVVLPGVGGSVAAGTTDSGNPVKVGGVYNTTFPTYTNGQRGDLQINGKGSLFTTFAGALAGDALPATTAAATSTDGTSSRPLAVTGHSFNGSTWDRNITCGNTAVVNVTAAATTQLVALASTQIVRVCSVAISMSAAGTAKFVYGTGTNCGTGTTDLTGAMALATGTPLTISGGGGSVLRTPASNALCLAAVTGNVTGWITYAQY